ncbi:MAG: hypothetical protein IPI10_16275 [Bacteroidetes bacterium]|nr:hypothetical protein [Bacteroidota bacterium]
MFSGITDYNLKTDFTWVPSPQHNVKFGANYIYHVFVPSNASACSGDVNFNLGDIVKQYAHDAALYFNDEFELNAKMAFQWRRTVNNVSTGWAIRTVLSWIHLLIFPTGYHSLR